MTCHALRPVVAEEIHLVGAGYLTASTSAGPNRAIAEVRHRSRALCGAPVDDGIRVIAPHADGRMCRRCLNGRSTMRESQVVGVLVRTLLVRR